MIKILNKQMRTSTEGVSTVSFLNDNLFSANGGFIIKTQRNGERRVYDGDTLIMWGQRTGQDKLLLGLIQSKVFLFYLLTAKKARYAVWQEVNSEEINITNITGIENSLNISLNIRSKYEN